jgi:CRP-like cAMP-binding protein
MDDIIKALNKCAIFKGLDNAKIQELLSKTKYQVRQYNKNELIFREDQYSENIGIIIVGCIEIQKILASGNLICIFHNNQGDTFGGAVVFSSMTTYPCDVFSRCNSIILFFPKQSIFEMCNENLIAKNLLNTFANKIIQYEKRLELFSYSSIQKKIAFFLLDELKTNNNNTINLSFTKKTWAEYLNVSRPSLCRELKKLCDNNLIKIKMNKISILNKAQLTNILQQ